MKAIMNGKRYDTTAATLVAEDHGGGYNFRDFHYWEEQLFRTERGTWFLFGRGGGLSHYAVSVAGGSGYGERIIPLTAEEARNWLEAHHAIAALEQLFGEEIEDA